MTVGILRGRYRVPEMSRRLGAAARFRPGLRVACLASTHPVLRGTCLCGGWVCIWTGGGAVADDGLAVTCIRPPPPRLRADLRLSGIRIGAPALFVRDPRSRRRALEMPWYLGGPSRFRASLPVSRIRIVRASLCDVCRGGRAHAVRCLVIARIGLGRARRSMPGSLGAPPGAGPRLARIGSAGLDLRDAGRLTRIRAAGRAATVRLPLDRCCFLPMSRRFSAPAGSIAVLTAASPRSLHSALRGARRRALTSDRCCVVAVRAVLLPFGCARASARGIRIRARLGSCSFVWKGARPRAVVRVS